MQQKTARAFEALEQFKTIPSLQEKEGVMPKNSVLQSPQKRVSTMSERGRKGGMATLERHGVHHMRVIGTAGLQAVLETRWNGDARAFRSYLSRCRWANRAFDENLACMVRQAVMA